MVTIESKHQQENNMKSFNNYNTEGYSQIELNALNAEWAEIVASQNLEEYTEEYDFAEKAFSDLASRR